MKPLLSHSSTGEFNSPPNFFTDALKLPKMKTILPLKVEERREGEAEDGGHRGRSAGGSAFHAGGHGHTPASLRVAEKEAGKFMDYLRHSSRDVLRPLLPLPSALRLEPPIAIQILK
eukprot:1124551-Prorocentrum_minimum.AAC.2